MTAATENDLRYEGWRVAGAATLGVYFASIVVYGFAVLLKPLSEEFGWSRETVSTAYAVMALTNAVCAPMLGTLLDRFGPKRIAIPCITLCGVAIASLSLLTASRAQLYVTFSVLGLGVVGTTALVYSRAVSTWFDARRGLALAVVISGGALAAITHPPAIAALIAVTGWRRACLLLGALVLVVGVPIIAAFVRERGTSRRVQHVDTDGATVREAIGSWILWIVIVALAGATMSLSAIIVHLPSLLTDRGIETHRAAMALSSLGVGSLAGRLLSGWLMDRFLATRVSAVLLTTGAIGVALLALVPSFELSLVAALLIGFGLGGELDVTPFLISRYFGLRAVSTLYGFAWSAMGLAGAAGPILMGRAFDTTGSYVHLLLILSGVTVAVASLMLTLPRYDRRMPTADARPADAHADADPLPSQLRRNSNALLP